MPVREAYAQAAMCDYLRQREVGRLDIEIALDNLQVRCDGAEELVRLLVRDVSQAEDLPYLPRREKLLELRVERSACGRRRGAGLQGFDMKMEVVEVFSVPLRVCPMHPVSL